MHIWCRFNRTSFQQQLKLPHWCCHRRIFKLQSYILSTTTETGHRTTRWTVWSCFNRTSFQQQLKPANVNFLGCSTDVLQSYILSTTTETPTGAATEQQIYWLQSYILSTTTETTKWHTPLFETNKLQSYILSTTTETVQVRPSRRQ